MRSSCYNGAGDRMKTYLIFDMDGTLYDLYQPFAAAARKVLKAAAPSEEQLKNIFFMTRFYSDQLRATLHLSGHDLVCRRNALAFADEGITLTTKQLEELEEAYAFFQERIQMEAWMEQLLQRLTEKNCVLALLSNGDEAHQRQKAAVLGVNRYIPVKRQFFSGMVQADKPDPRVFHFVEQQLGIQSEDNVFYIGDGYESDVKGAMNVGWNAVYSRIYAAQQPAVLEVQPMFTADSKDELSQILTELAERG